MGNVSSARSKARVFWCAVASLDVSGGVRRKGSGLGRWGSQTLRRLASRAGQCDPRLVPVGRGDALTSYLAGGLAGRWGRSVFLWHVCLKRPGGQHWDALIESSVRVVILMPVTNFLSLSPDIVWRGAVEDWSLAPGVASKGSGVRVGMCSARQWHSGFAKMQGWPAGKRAVAPSGMFRQRGRGERHWVALHLFWDDASEKETEVGAAA